MSFDLSLIAEKCKRHYVLIKDFSTFKYDHTLYRGRKHFCRYCLQAFSTAGYKLVFVDDKFSKPFKSYFDGDAVYNIIDSIVESKYYTDVMKKHFNKELAMTKKG